METVEIEEFKPDSSKIPFVQILSLFFLILSLVIFIFYHFFIFFLPQLVPSKENQSEAILRDFAEYKQTLPLAIIDYHSSKYTFHRIIFLYENYLKNNIFLKSNIFKIRILYSDFFVPNTSFINSQSNIEFISVNCPDTILSLSCRVDQGYKSFLSDSENDRINWLYRATDDSFINFENLYLYITKLNKNYDPMNDLVVRAHANFQMKSNYYIHGGPGYLMSKEYVRYHFTANLTLTRLHHYSKYLQDDTAESIIVRKIFKKSYKQWDEFYINGFKCQNCIADDIQSNKLPKCPPDKRIGNLNKIISFHMFGLKNQQHLFLKLLLKKSRYLKISQTLYDSIRFYNDDVAQSLVLCKSKLGRIEKYNINRHKKIVSAQLKNPLIELDKLTPEGKYSHLFEV